MPVKLVVFDIAGTTVQDDDHSVSKAFQASLANFGFTVALEAIDPLMGYEKTLAIRKILTEAKVDRNLVTDELVSKIHQVFVQGMIAHYAFDTNVAPLPGVEETFIKLHDMGIMIGINTGFSHDIAETIIKRFKWLDRGLIDCYIGSDEVEAGRPHPFMINNLMEFCDVSNPKQVVKVGDTEVDVREGQNAGCLYSIGVTTGIFTRLELEKYKPDYIIDSLAELIPIITSA